MISAGTLAQISKLSEEVERVARALEAYFPKMRGLKAIVDAVERCDSPELKETAQKLQRLIKKAIKFLSGSEMKFASHAPSSIYPKREEVVGNLLLNLSGSPNLKGKGKTFAADLMASWFKERVSKGEVKIDGLYSPKKVV